MGSLSFSGPAILQAVSENAVTKEALETLQEAMDLLQTRFTQVMREKADIIERCQELEHQNLQLAGETETIGKNGHVNHSGCIVTIRWQDSDYTAIGSSDAGSLQR